MTITEEAASARDMERPGLSSVREALREGTATVLVVSKLDRLSRSLLDFATLLGQAQDEGWSLVALDQAIDTTSPNGRLCANVMMSVAEWERERLRERITEGLAAARLKGIRPGRRSALPEETRDYIFRLHAGEGLAYRTIADRLNAEGIPTAAHGQRGWTHVQVRRAYRDAELVEVAPTP